jgi:hypothetical protein
MKRRVLVFVVSVKDAVGLYPLLKICHLPPPLPPLRGAAKERRGWRGRKEGVEGVEGVRVPHSSHTTGGGTAVRGGNTGVGIVRATT